MPQGPSDYIIRQMMGAAGQEPGQEGQQMAAPQGPQGQVAQPAPPQGGQGQVDPMVDDIAKKLATLEGTPEQKYQILVQVVPQIVQAFMGRMQQEQGNGGM